MWNKSLKSGGYSLVEILIAVVLIGVGLISVAGVYPFGLAHIRIMGERVFAVQQAQARMEELKSMSYTSLEAMKDDEQEFDVVDTNKKKIEKFTGRFLVSDPPSEVTENVLQLQVEIEWNESNPFGKRTVENRTFVLTSYKRPQSNEI